MVTFERFKLSNGLQTIFHYDPHTPMATISVLYDVGSKDEEPDKTGFTHLFEHLMFSGSKNAPDFDGAMQSAGGDNNAYTNSDMTHFYNILPAENLETALFLEADRMHNLIINEKTFETQRNVVIEEFMETCYNQPYGDLWHHLLDLTFTQHPYRWPTIGLTPDHIANAQLEDVVKYYHSHYLPSNAILAIGGNFHSDQVREIAEKYFGQIPAGVQPLRPGIVEPRQDGYRKKVIDADVPSDAIYLAFKMGARNSSEYYPQDLLTDILANGPSSRLISHLIKDESSFVSVDSYVYGSSEPGLLIIEGQPAEGIDLETAEEILWKEINRLKKEDIPQEELDRQLNKVRTNLILSETSSLGKTMSLAYYELLGNIDLINSENDRYQAVDPQDLKYHANKILNEDNCSMVGYRSASS
ncbi:MAG: pitrilysin family protein [Saprospiraceae bacterium]|nr:pitrilysin family protein [Saprospiraceae bacterium]